MKHLKKIKKLLKLWLLFTFTNLLNYVNLYKAADLFENLSGVLMNNDSLLIEVKKLI